MAGTPCFMAPEVIKRQPYGFTADSFSVGATACYMFCGHPPPDREDLKDDQVWDVEIKKSLDRISSLDTLSTSLSVSSNIVH
jgi:serine/threonine protein kinase